MKHCQHYQARATPNGKSAATPSRTAIVIGAFLAARVGRVERNEQIVVEWCD
jgi:hypothetical protein